MLLVFFKWCGLWALVVLFLCVLKVFLCVLKVMRYLADMKKDAT